MNNSKVGLDGREASYALRDIESSYIDLMTTINSYQDVLNEVANGWFGNDVIEFGNKSFKPSISMLSNEINKCIQSVHDTIAQNAKNFEMLHQTNVFNDPGHHQISVDIDTSVLKESRDGFIGIESPILNSSLGLLPPIGKKCSANLDAIQKAAARSGFYGENQQEKLSSSMSRIKQSIEEIEIQLSNAIKNRIVIAEQEERQLAIANANSMDLVNDPIESSRTKVK